MATTTAGPFTSRPSRALEGIMLAFPVFLTLTVVALLGSTTPDLPTSTFGLLLIALWGIGLLVALAIPVVLYLDAKGLQDHDAEWTPSPALYAVFGFFFSGLTLLHYLYRRQETFGTESADGRWWYVAVGLVALSVLTAVAGSVFGGLSFFAAFSVLVLAPIALYLDAKHVRAAEAGWQPNPTTQFGIGFIALYSVIGAPFYLGYYAFRRAQSVGLR